MAGPDRRGTSEISIGKIPGLLRLGTIVAFESDVLRVQVHIGGFKEYNAMKRDYNNLIWAQLPISYFSPIGGMFVGGYPELGTPVIMGQGEGGQWYVVGVLAKDPAALNTSRPATPDLEPGVFHLQANTNTFIQLSQDEGITLGERGNQLNLDTQRDLYTNTFDNTYSFTEASRTIEGIIRRDKEPNIKSASYLREKSPNYNDQLKVIALDPIAKDNYSNAGSSVRNPARTEKRETIYEFGKSFNILSNEQEFLSYQDNKNINITDILNRREGRADALSLSLVAPNYLMETIKGTVVDIYGNILDINRAIIPIGKTDKLSIKKIKTNLTDISPLGNIFANIKTAERREIAYHFEINSKKDLVGAPDASKNNNYARQRSRFSLDVDKEGLFKLNVPASSETGNIPFLTRYENFSTITPNPDTNDPNDLVVSQNLQDIMIESFIGTNAVVEVIDDLSGNAAPIDRFSSADSPKYIKHGTAYHNISDTCKTFQQDKSLFYERTVTTNLASGRVLSKQDIVSKKVMVSGKKANAGGRSGSINFDGSLDINIGANTVDRHSLWLDLQGALIGNIGRDIRNSISAALQFDGEVLIQSGGSTPNLDERFNSNNTAGNIPGVVDLRNLNNGHSAGVIDLRVITQSGKVNVIRIDNEGISIHSESRIVMYSNGDMMFRSTGTMNIDAENLLLNGRKVRREVGLGSI